MEFLIALHELIEWKLTRERGILESDIRAFDEANPDHDDPGRIPEAPYHKEHMFAEVIEQLMALQLGVNWDHYCRATLATFDGEK